VRTDIVAVVVDVVIAGVDRAGFGGCACRRVRTGIVAVWSTS
jgi:hypothetical protein